MGVWAGVGAYVLWGVLALYWKQLAHVEPSEILAHRVLWSFVFGCVILGILGGGGRLLAILREPRAFRAALVATALIATNWFLFLWAVDRHRVTEISLGYYINPLLNVLLGALVLKEKLRNAQRLAVVLAAVGVAFFIVSVGSLPWVSLVLAMSFGIYGLVRKVAAAGPIEGLTLEVGFVSPIALVFLLLRDPPGGVVLDGGITAGFLFLAGPLTALPLLLFAYSARRIPYSTLGMLQYIAPTLQLLCAVTAFGEPFTERHLVTFAFVWSGLALYATDTLMRRPFLVPAGPSR
ncbi:MAG: EamA family transporter RarD [Myxococcota bacterium]